MQTRCAERRHSEVSTYKCEQGCKTACSHELVATSCPQQRHFINVQTRCAERRHSVAFRVLQHSEGAMHTATAAMEPSRFQPPLLFLLGTCRWAQQVLLAWVSFVVHLSLARPTEPRRARRPADMASKRALRAVHDLATAQQQEKRRSTPRRALVPSQRDKSARPCSCRWQQHYW